MPYEAIVRATGMVSRGGGAPRRTASCNPDQRKHAGHAHRAAGWADGEAASRLNPKETNASSPKRASAACCRRGECDRLRAEWSRYQSGDRYTNYRQVLCHSRSGPPSDRLVSAK